MTCTACAQANPDGAKFCRECGAPLTPPGCPSCGAPVTGGRFCSECGASLTAAEPAVVARPRLAERRRTSVLFADLVGFTTLSESRDPEEVRELLSRYFTESRTVVERYGGTVEKFIGDAVMAVWGVPTAHEDDAERAVRAGLDLVDTVRALGEDLGATGLALRVGIVTGEVAVTLGATGEGMVAGDAVNTAARVQSAAEPGTVLVDQVTRELTVAAVAYSDAGQHALKGKAEPMTLHRARTVVAAVGGAQRVDGLEAPFTGRDRELRLVKELFHATAEEGRPRLVTVTGAAGMGKTRLGWEFEKYVDGLRTACRWHRGRCLSYGEGVAFWAFAEMIRSRAGMTEADGLPEQAAKARAMLEQFVPDAEERAWLAPRVGVLLGEQGTSFDRHDLFAAWTLFLERVGEGREPVILLFEDMHHADAGLLDLVEHLVDSARFPLFVLAFGRPELLERRPSLTSGRRTTPLYLEPLGDAAMAALVDGLVEGLPDKARASLVERAEGVPLYAVETVRSLIDRDAVVPREGRYVFDSAVDLDGLAAPASLQTLVAARLDALSPDERHVVQDASVLGLSFTGAALAALSDSGDDLSGLLDALVRKEILEQQNDPRSPERGSYRFVQAIVRSVAYDTLSRRDRKARHLTVAAYLAAGDARGDLAAVIAQHHLDALDASSTDDSDRQDLAAAARSLLARAAARAERLGSPEEAHRHARTALGRDPQAAERAELLETAARTAASAGRLEDALELAQETRAAWLELERPDDAARAVVLEADALAQQGRILQAFELLKPVDEQFRDVDRPGTPRLAALTALSAMCSFLGRHEEAQDYGLRALQVAEAEGDVDGVVRALYRAATVLLFLGSPTAGRALLLEGVAVARAHRLDTALAQCLNNLSSVTYPHDLEQALDYAQETLALHEQTGNRQRQLIAAFNLASMSWLAGRWDEVEELAARWLEDGRAPDLGLSFVRALTRHSRGEPVPEVEASLDHDDAWDRAIALDLRALGAAAAGDDLEALDLAERAFREFLASYRYEDDAVVFLALALQLAAAAGRPDRLRVLLALGDAAPRPSRSPLLEGELALHRGLLAVMEGVPDAESLLRDAVGRLQAYGAPGERARAEVALAGVLGRDGRAAEADELLDSATAAFTALRCGRGLESVLAARADVLA